MQYSCYSVSKKKPGCPRFYTIETFGFQQLLFRYEFLYEVNLS